MSIRLSMIAAVADNGVIGNGGGMPWRLPSDFAFFKRMTLGKPLVMGRKTFESIGRPLPGRTNIVVTRQAGFQPDNVLVFNDLTAALDHAATIARADGVDEFMIGGGAEIYGAALPKADRLYVTHVAVTPDGDARFPFIDPEAWRVVDEPELVPHAGDTAAFRVKIYDRAQGHPTLIPPDRFPI